ncbi:DoxX family protein [Tsukamurella ocularis]|uniref:DoxX family protein n=1 Tax=Tsukamurella ocularis TaxID=1970234 RepID=UPI0039EED210
MDIGLLILRLLLGTLIAGHALQKLTGAFGGLGPDGTAPIFEKWGLVPGKPLVVLAALLELLGALLVVFGLATPLGAAILVGVMAVAASVNVANGLWAQGGGYELALAYGGTAAALCFTGPGGFSLDRLIGLDGYDSTTAGVVAVIVAAVAAAAFIGYASRHKGRSSVATEA